MLANERVITIACSSPAGETRTRCAAARRAGCSPDRSRRSSGDRRRRTCSATSTASEVEPDREMTMTGWRPAGPVPSTPVGRRMSSDSGAATDGPPGHLARDRGRDLGQVVRRAGPGQDRPGRHRRTRRPSRARRSGATRRARPRSRRPRSRPRARSAAGRGPGMGEDPSVGRAVIGRATPRRNGNGRPGPCSGSARSAGRPGRRRSARPGGPGSPRRWSSSAALVGAQEDRLERLARPASVGSRRRASACRTGGRSRSRPSRAPGSGRPATGSSRPRSARRRRAGSGAGRRRWVPGAIPSASATAASAGSTVEPEDAGPRARGRRARSPG